MRSFIASLILLALTPYAYAEYYIECREPVLNVITINCRGHHCSYSNHHVGQPDWGRHVHSRHCGHHYRHHHRHHYRHHRHHYYHERYYRDVMGCCDMDGATGDDNPCQDPNMQIN